MSDHLRGYGWRHATWCRWEKAEGTCDCGLREHQDAASPPAADPLDVERLEDVLTEHFGPSYWPGLHDVTILGDSPRAVAEQIAAEYARLTREGEQR